MNHYSPRKKMREWGLIKGPNLSFDSDILLVGKEII